MRLSIFPSHLFFTLLLCCTSLTQASFEDPLDQFNVEQILLFLVPHLQSSLASPGMLHYRFENHTTDKRGLKQLQRQGRVTLFVHPRSEQEKIHSVVNFLKGEPDGALLDVYNNGQNPLVTTFLQWDVDNMATVLDAHSDYFRHLIRYSLASRNVSHESVQVSYRGKMIKAIKVVFKPFPQALMHEKFQHLAEKQYEFIIGAKIPGGIYQVMTSMPEDIHGTVEYTVLSLSTFIPAPPAH